MNNKYIMPKRIYFGKKPKNGNGNGVVVNSDISDDEDEQCGINKENQKITKVNNHIYYYAEVDRNSVFALSELIRKAEKENLNVARNFSIEPPCIYLHISSFGGSVFDAFTAIDVITSCKVDVVTIIDGATASAGTLMSVTGKKRYIRPHAYMLIHQLSSGSWGKMNELEDDFENNKKLMSKIKDIYKEYTKVPKKELAEILKHDLWWESDTCLKYGLVDELWEES
uniref:Protease n=1 Tax=viral metagenome TaxID=1070528 RepID=A0A6C0AWW2_9ZZZZ